MAWSEERKKRFAEYMKKQWQTVFFLEKEAQTILRYFVDFVTRITFLKRRTQAQTDSSLYGSDVIVQRYVDYTGNNKIKRNGEEIIWQK